MCILFLYYPYYCICVNHVVILRYGVPQGAGLLERVNWYHRFAGINVGDVVLDVVNLACV